MEPVSTTDRTIPQEVAAIIAQIPQWANARSISVAALQDVISLNNTNYKVTIDGQPYVVRIAAETTHWLGVQRADERAAAYAAAQIGVGPPILYFDDAGNMVMPWINGRHWETHDFQNPANCTRVIETLRRLHAVTNVQANGSVFNRIERLIANAVALNIELPDTLEQQRLILHQIEAQRQQDEHAHSGLCHNDFWANNFLDDGQQLWLLDWEFSGDADWLFDLATFALSARFNEAQIAEMLAQYGYLAPHARAQLHAMTYVVWFFEGMWALVQHGLRGSADYDYRAHAERQFQRMNNHFAEYQLRDMGATSGV